tara:strand:- start:466 stop:657 length:192 start_codon:yes stop_codon:yes gene_type:complete
MRDVIIMKTSDICILISVAVAFVTTAYLWFAGVDTKQEALFTSTWIPSILTFAIYFKLIARKD